MLRYINHDTMGRSKKGWLDSYFHFSFAEYHNPANINFGVLRVLNDDLVQAGTGFDAHPHKNMEILSYVVDGELTHQDSLGNEETLGRGQVQYMSAGTGVYHSEYNLGAVPLRFLQIWIVPDASGHMPAYGSQTFAWEERINAWMPIAAQVDDRRSRAPIRMHADINMYATFLEAGQSLDFHVAVDRQAYLVLLEGKLQVNDINMYARDALESVEEYITLQTTYPAHAFLLEMARPH